VKETPGSFERRTGLSYSPPPSLLEGRTRPLGTRESCPTLFRYPGPEGLLEALRGGLARLAPVGADRVWLASRPTAERARAARLFGTLALLQPLHLQPVATRRSGIFLAPNAPLPRDAEPVWVSPSQVAARIAWDRLRTEPDAVRRFGGGYADERARTLDRLSAYLEEISALERAGAPALERPWLAHSARERRRLLARLGIRATWTRT